MTILVISIQAQEIDTLFYYDPDGLVEYPCGYTDDVNDYAVYFTNNQLWDSYSIKKVEFLMPNYEPYHIYEFAVSKDSDIRPDSIIYLAPTDTLLENERFPNWKSVDLSSIETLQKMTGNFWIQGIALAQTLCNSFQSSGHSYVHLFLTDTWTKARDFTVRVIIEKNVTSLGNNNKKNYLIAKPELLVFPNPFNSSTKIKLSFQDKNTVRPLKVFIYNNNGKKIKSLNEHILNGKTISINWDSTSDNNKTVASGIYFLYVETRNYVQSRKLILIK
jgi:hypothetical protein